MFPRLFVVLLSIALGSCGSSNTDSENQRSGGAPERVRLFKTDFSQPEHSDGDVQTCDDNHFNAAEIQLPFQKGLSIKAVKKQITTECEGLKLTVSELIPTDGETGTLRVRLDGGWPICTLKFEGKTPAGKKSVFTVDLVDGC